MATAATFLYFEQAHLARAELPSRDERAAFFANIDLGTQAVVFVLQTVAGEAFTKDDVAHHAVPMSARAASRLNSQIACCRSAFFCTLPLAVMPMASKLATIAT